MVDSSNSSIVQIVLHIEDGNGFTFIHNDTKVYFVATLNGIILESVPVEAGNPTKFNTELVWEVKKKDLRELKISNIPIKVECYSIKEEERLKLGYLMLSLKSAPTLPPGTSDSFKKTWSKVLGVSTENRVFQPEILLQVFIEDNEKHLEIPIPQTKGLNMSVECQDLFCNGISPQLKNDKGYIQIGPEEICTENYLIHIYLASPSNLNVHTSERKYSNFLFFYNICGVDIISKEFQLDINGNSDFTEKTVVRVKSNLRFLRYYFNQVQAIRFYLLSNNIEIGNCQARIDDIIYTDDLSEFILNTRKNSYTVCKCNVCYFSRENEPESTNSGYLKIGISIKYVHPDGSPNYKNIPNEMLGQDNMGHSSSTMDQPPSLHLENIMKNLGTKARLEYKSTPQIIENTVHQNATANKCILETITEETNPTGINMNYIVKKAGGDKVEQSQTNENISIKIVEELEDWKEKQQEMFLAEESDNPTIFTSRIFLQKQIWYTRLLKKFIETNCEIVDMYQEVIDFIRVPFCKRVHNFIRISYDSWKDKNCRLLWTSGFLWLFQFNYWTTFSGDFIVFLVLQLKKKEEKHLSHLSSEWYKKRTEIESQLKKKIEHSRSLAVALEKANNDAKTAGIKNLDTEKQLIKAKEELERQYSLQYLDLKEAARRLEDDLNHKLSQSNIVKNELTEKIQGLQKENKKLQEIISKQQEEYESIKKSSLDKEQTATLVHQLKTTYEKLVDAQKSKAFFKEQWARALREVHRIKSDQQQNINVQIKRNKAIDFKTLLSEQESARYDNKELQEISRRLQSLSTDSSNQSSNCDINASEILGTCNLSTVLNGMDYFRTGFSSRSSTNTEDSDSDNAEARQLLKTYEINHIESEDE